MLHDLFNGLTVLDQQFSLAENMTAVRYGPAEDAMRDGKEMGANAGM